ITRRRISYYLLISGIFNRVRSSCYCAIAVEILIFYISRTKKESTTFKLGLIRNTFFTNISTVYLDQVTISILLKVILCKVSIRFIAPNFSKNLPFIIIRCYKITVVNRPGSLILDQCLFKIRYHGHRIDIQPIFKAVIEVHCQFPTFCLQSTEVSSWRSGTIGRWKSGSWSMHIAGSSFVPVKG